MIKLELAPYPTRDTAREYDLEIFDGKEYLADLFTCHSLERAEACQALINLAIEIANNDAWQEFTMTASRGKDVKQIDFKDR